VANVSQLDPRSALFGELGLMDPSQAASILATKVCNILFLCVEIAN